MAKTTLLALVAVLMLCFTGSAHAAARSPQRIAVHVICSCDDAMGQAYVSAFKSALSKDTRYIIDERADSEASMRINIISLPITTAEGQPGDALSVVCTHNGAMMHQFVTTCAHLAVTDCAKLMINDLGDLS